MKFRAWEEIAGSARAVIWYLQWDELAMIAIDSLFWFLHHRIVEQFFWKNQWILSELGNWQENVLVVVGHESPKHRFERHESFMSRVVWVPKCFHELRDSERAVQMVLIPNQSDDNYGNSVTTPRLVRKRKSCEALNPREAKVAWSLWAFMAPSSSCWAWHLSGFLSFHLPY